MPVHPLTGKSFLRVTYPAPESYLIIPSDWKLEDITVHHGELFHKGIRSFLVPRDFHSSKHELELVDSGHMDWPDCQEFLHADN